MSDGSVVLLTEVVCWIYDKTLITPQHCEVEECASRARIGEARLEEQDDACRDQAGRRDGLLSATANWS